MGLSDGWAVPGPGPLSQVMADLFGIGLSAGTVANNSAEREIRMIRLRQKVSGCMRTLAGAQRFATIRSYLATTTKNDIDALNALVRLAQGQPWLPETT